LSFEYLIIAGGEIPPLSYIRKLIKISKKIVTVDRGAHCALKLKIKPLLHIGDHDSFSESLIRKLKSQSVIHLDKNKSVSDLEFALESLNIATCEKPILVIGAHKSHEKRSDHAYINMVLLQRSNNIYFSDEKNWITTIPSAMTFRFKTKKNAIFSLVTIGQRENAVNIQGAKFNGKLNLKKPSQGLSNVTKRSIRILTQHKTLLFVSSDLTQDKIDDPRFRS
jgi:thiamine pyrophosphokinase